MEGDHKDPAGNQQAGHLLPHDFTSQLAAFLQMPTAHPSDIQGDLGIETQNNESW